MALNLEQLRQQQAIADARVSDLDWHLRLAKTEHADLRAQVCRLLRCGRGGCGRGRGRGSMLFRAGETPILILVRFGFAKCLFLRILGHFVLANRQYLIMSFSSWRNAHLF